MERVSSTHNHGGSPQRWGKAFAIGIALNVAFVIIEVVYGLAANSSALLADAGHNASDVLSLVFAWAAIWVATKKPSGRYTYGLRRTTILASILNGLLILVAVGFIVWDAVEKLYRPVPVAGMTVIFVAAVGVVINSITALMFMRGQKHDLNIQGAFLHMAADAAVSLGVVVAGAIIYYTNTHWVDPLVSFVIVAVILYGTWGLLRDSVDLALDAVPNQVDIEDVRRYLDTHSDIASFHDLHIWAMSTTETALTAHVVLSTETDETIVFAVRDELRRRFGIGHSTLQVERREDCENRCDGCGL